MHGIVSLSQVVAQVRSEHSNGPLLVITTVIIGEVEIIIAALKLVPFLGYLFATASSTHTNGSNCVEHTRREKKKWKCRFHRQLFTQLLGITIGRA